MVLAQFEFARRTHHAVRFDAADRRDLQHHAVGRDGGARHAEHADQPRAGIGRAAHDLQRAPISYIGAGIDRQHLQLVRLRMGFGAQHAGDTERGQFLARILDALDLQPDAGEAVQDRIQRGIGGEMLVQPAQGELHAPTPPTAWARPAPRSHDVSASAGRRRRTGAGRPCRISASPAGRRRCRRQSPATRRGRGRTPR